MPFRRSSEANLLRTRHPAGIITAAEATDRLTDMYGQVLRQVEASLGRLILEFQDDPVHRVVISGVLRVTESNGMISVHPDPSTWDVTEGQILDRAVETQQVSAAGSLRLEIAGTTLQVDPDPHHEAWEVRGSDGWLLACLPGGALSLWTPSLGRIPQALGPA